MTPDSPHPEDDRPALYKSVMTLWQAITYLPTSDRVALRRGHAHLMVYARILSTQGMATRRHASHTEGWELICRLMARAMHTQDLTHARAVSFAKAPGLGAVYARAEVGTKHLERLLDLDLCAPGYAGQSARSSFERIWHKLPTPLFVQWHDVARLVLDPSDDLIRPKIAEDFYRTLYLDP